MGFHRDKAGDWVAELSCLHGQHVRHQPPFRLAPWVLDEAERAGRVGTALDCPLCDRTELPDGLQLRRTTATWDDASMPAALRSDHRVAAGVWGRLVVLDGTVGFRAATRPPLDVVVAAGETQPIPPEVDHAVTPGPGARFLVEFLGP